MEEHRGLAAGEEVEENIEQASAVTSVRNEKGSKYDGNEETTGGGTCGGEDGNTAKNLITKDGKGTPEHNGILQNGGTPKSGGTSKSIDTPERNATPKSGSTPKRNGTPKSADTPKRNRTPKSGTPEHSVRLKSGGTPRSVGTPESNGVLRSVGTYKSSRTSDSSISRNGGSMVKGTVMPKNDGTRRRTGAAQIGGKQNVSNRSHKSHYT